MGSGRRRGSDCYWGNGSRRESGGSGCHWGKLAEESVEGVSLLSGLELVNVPVGGVAVISRLDAVVVPIPIALWVGDLQVQREGAAEVPVLNAV